MKHTSFDFELPAVSEVDSGWCNIKPTTPIWTSIAPFVAVKYQLIWVHLLLFFISFFFFSLFFQKQKENLSPDRLVGAWCWSDVGEDTDERRTTESAGGSGFAIASSIRDHFSCSICFTSEAIRSGLQWQWSDVKLALSLNDWSANCCDGFRCHDIRTKSEK